ncbi:MAG TPA: TIGR03435 family protein [Vicinamibacterales bacterium]|nr:TIGR03435 family protein [Vicinamibacterales bacterium]
MALAVGLVVSIIAARAQNATTVRAFEVASVKANDSGDFRRAIGPGPGGRFQALNNTLRELVTYAYGVDMARAGLQVTGGPPWMDRDRFDVDAIAPVGTATPAEIRDMVRALLIERFELQAHRETRELPTYDLVVDRRDARTPAGLRTSTIDCEARRAARRGGPPPVAPPGPPPNPETIRPVCGLRQTPARLAGDAVTMPQLASALGPPSGRIVFDRTGLSGYFDVDLAWIPGQEQQSRPDGAPIPAVDPSMPLIFTAIREQLGLRLEGSRAPVEVVVVVSAEHPSGN